MAHQPGDGQPVAYRIRLTGTELAPATMSCAGQVLKPSARSQVTAFSRLA